MQQINMILNTPPKAQMRARAKKSGKLISMYKHENQIENEKIIKYLLKKYIPKEPLKSVLKIQVFCYMPIPSGTSKKKRELMKTQAVYHTKKPDVDNLLKNILDCMTSLKFWKDDAQVAIVEGYKVYSDTPRWEIDLAETDFQTI